MSGSARRRWTGASCNAWDYDSYNPADFTDAMFKGMELLNLVCLPLMRGIWNAGDAVLANLLDQSR